MPARICVVSYRDTCGLEHSVEVAAESLYEAAALALAAFRAAPLADLAPGRGAELAVSVRAEVACASASSRIGSPRPAPPPPSG